jgi:hypothetical protein
VAEIVNVNVPEVVGVPLTSPVVGVTVETESPGGKFPNMYW